MKKNMDLEQDSIGQLLIALSLPAIASQIINACYNIIDRIFIGHIENTGALSLTGVGICFPIIMIISAFSYLIGMGAAPRASIFMGKKDRKTAEKILGNSFSALIIMSIILTILILLFKEPLLYLFGASENTIDYAKSYLTIYAIGTIFVQLTLGMNAFISAQGFSRVSMMTVCIGAIINIILDPILIFKMNMGVRGAALATVISQSISCVWAIYFLARGNTILKLKHENFKIEFEILKPCIELGVAPFVMLSTESILVLCFNGSLLKYGGDPAVGAMTILSSVMQFTLLPITGITQGGQPILSYNFGAGNRDRLEKTFKLQTIACFGYAFLVWIACVFFPRSLVSIFTSNEELIIISSWALRIYMADIFLMGLQDSCQQAFVSFGNAKVSTFLAIFRKIVLLIPLIYILPHFINDKVFAIFLAEPIADFFAVVMTCVLFYREYGKK